MSLSETIQKDLVDATKAQNKEVVNTLRLFLSEISKKEIELGKKDEGLDEKEINAVLIKEIKKRKDSVKQYRDGNRDDLAEAEEKEIEILEKYAPELMGEEDISKIVDEVISEKNASSMQDMGSVMASVMKKIGSSADGEQVNKIVRSRLS